MEGLMMSTEGKGLQKQIWQEILDAVKDETHETEMLA